MKKKMFIIFAAAAVVAGGFTAAKMYAADDAASPQSRAKNLQHVTNQLELTSEQRPQIRGIFVADRDYSFIGKFFDTLRLMDGIQIQYRFDDGYAPWIVTCQLKADTDWQQIKAQLKAQAERVPLGQRYFLSPDAVALLQWIQELHTDEIQAGLTPVVEEHLGKTLSFQAKWDYNNTRTYLELLVGEINENTEYQLRALDWRHYSNTGTRILVKQKKTEMEEVVRAIRVLGLQKDKILTKEKARAALDGLLGEI